MDQPTRLRYDDGGWAERVGGHIVLDLLNTVAWRLDTERAVDRLTDGAALVRWARFAGVLTDDRAEELALEVAGDEETGRRVAGQVRDLRERAYAVLQPIAVGLPPARSDLDALQRGLLATLGRAELSELMPLQWSTTGPSSGPHGLRDLPDELGLATWSLLQGEDRDRLRQCQDADCGWLFLDRTRNGSRVWCSSSDCGNRARARRHYRRHAAPASASASASAERGGSGP